MKRFLLSCVGVGAFLLTSGLSAQQAPPAGGAPAPLPAPKNLKFFPKDRTTEQILPIMQAFNQALGVGCAHCHVFDGPPLTNPKNDLASDEKPEKDIARVMLAMARDVNMQLGSELGKPAAEVTQVQCVTCHRGVAVPKQLVAIMMETARTENIAAAVQQYRELRQKYYGSQAYDFTDATLFNAANQSNTAMKPDDALAFAQLNLEFNPNSARTHQAMSQAYQRKSDKDSAIKSLERAIELDPMNQGFKNQLQQLRGN
jgi:hypothetical protein